jgi:hypothetical protein
MDTGNSAYSPLPIHVCVKPVTHNHIPVQHITWQASNYLLSNVPNGSLY